DALGYGGLREQLVRQPVEDGEQLLERGTGRAHQRARLRPAPRGECAGTRRLRRDHGGVSRDGAGGVSRGRGSARRAARARGGSGDSGSGGRRRAALADARQQPVSRRRRELPGSDYGAELRADQRAGGGQSADAPDDGNGAAAEGSRRRLARRDVAGAGVAVITVRRKGSGLAVNGEDHDGPTEAPTDGSLDRNPSREVRPCSLGPDG